MVGVFNTLFNLLMFNLLIFICNTPVFVANTIAISISILISFYLNKYYVFKPSSNDNSSRKQFLLFILITIFSQLVIQQFFLFLFTEVTQSPGLAIFNLITMFGLSSISRDFVVFNVAKGIGIFFSLLTNYVLYDSKVFKKNM